jgi:MFS transporter, MHS family, proline/betaine transporter
VLGYSIKDALLISTLSMILLMLLGVPTAALSDRWGRRRMLMATAVVYFVASYPLFWLMTQPGFLSALTAVMLLIDIVGFYIGAAPTVFVELFPTSVRYTGMAISYKYLCSTAAIVETWMIKQAHGMNTIPAFYLMSRAVQSFIAFIAFIGYHDRYKEELQQ